MTAVRFTEIVTSSVLNLEGFLSIQLPTEEDKQSAAKVVQRPLETISPEGFSHWAWIAYRIDEASKVLGKAYAVKRVCGF